ncbi:MAG TPA: ABC transporter permease [Acidocella sp.]|jgi:ribose transport system permease protein|uniref:ABC transporter permease n=1 Tax=Acidocella sp. TaxID=50710 RepID=UPI002CAEE184|nr:ABC transporter permease [Acidocella sp.]HVE22538.1 ABC transporter permease [Acidocella sp.]
MPSEALADRPAIAKPRRRALTHGLTQNAPVLLALTMLIVSLVLYVAIFLLTQHHLPGGFEITTTVNDTMPLAAAAAGQTLVVLTRGIDLSVGGIIDMSNAIAAVTLRDTPASMSLVTVMVLLIGAAAGLVNGLLVAVGRLQPILVTLATLSIFQGIAIRILPQPGGSVPQIYTNILANPNAPWSLVYIALLGALWWAFRRSSLGVAILAIGNDPMAASSNGINVVRARVMAYVLAGMLAAAGGLFLAASATGGDATTGDSFTLRSIVAIVLGGVSLFGGRGSAVGGIIGAFITIMIANLLFFAHVNQLYESFFEGVFLLIAVVAASGIGYLARRRA